MTESTTTSDSRKPLLLTIPGVVVSLIPSLSCPLCWPAYAALLSSLGLGFVGTSKYLFPLTAALLAVAIGGLVWRARSKGYGPSAFGLLSAAMILPGKFFLASSTLTYAGVALLALASAWSLVLRRSASSVSCSTCAPSGAGSHRAV